MQALEQSFDLDQFFQQLRRASQRVLMLDYDGTLAPFHINPAEARPYPGVTERIDAIMDDPRTHVIVVTGRWIRDLLPLLEMRQLPEIWGSHGREQRRASGEYEVAQLDETALKGLVEADAWTPQIERMGGRCERKPGSFAIHWRALSPEQIIEIKNLVHENWMDAGIHRQLEWHYFDGGIELRAPGRHKGMVVDTLLAATSPDAAAAYLGDDLTDEDAFKAMKGRGISVLVRPQPRPTAADCWIRPPEELLEFLETWRRHSGVPS
ncbi:MAG TPA: trehalose-phosphatase [Burkholderiaceae bacterium]|nr:trehalose-phosphatase [Burkholderiaceae bacterium]